MSNSKLATSKLTKFALLTSIELVMTLTPLGYLKVGVIEVSFLTIPISLAALILGWKESLFLGFIFGISSFLQCLGTSSFGTILLSLNPIYTFLVCVLPRILIGLSPYFLIKVFKNKNFGSFFASAAAALTNTILFFTLLLIFFGETEFIQSFGNSLWTIICSLGLLNGLVEAVISGVIGGVVSNTLFKTKKN